MHFIVLYSELAPSVRILLKSGEFEWIWWRRRWSRSCSDRRKDGLRNLRLRKVKQEILEAARRIRSNEFQQFRARRIIRSRSKYPLKLSHCSQPKQLTSLMTPRFNAIHDRFYDGASDDAIRFKYNISNFNCLLITLFYTILVLLSCFYYIFSFIQSYF